MIDRQSLRWTGLTATELEAVLAYALEQWGERKLLYWVADAVRDTRGDTNPEEVNADIERRATKIENLASKL